MSLSMASSPFGASSAPLPSQLLPSASATKLLDLMASKYKDDGDDEDAYEAAASEYEEKKKKQSAPILWFPGAGDADCGGSDNGKLLACLAEVWANKG
jgi:hypothetical protein